MTGREGRADAETHPRRGVLQAMGALGIGVGGGFGSPGRLAAALEAAVDEATAPSPGREDPHTMATFAAVVDAVVPETPDLAEKLGAEHEAGGLAVDLHRGTVAFLDSFVSPEASVPRAAPTGETASLSASVAAALDAGAAELLARGGNEDDPEPGRFEGGGPFASLSRRDRFRAMAEVEAHGGSNGAFVVALATAFPAILYYSDWAGYDEFTAPPSERTFDGDVQGWVQTGYEGPTDGAAVLLGYELDAFEETYGTADDASGQGNGGGL